jgi:hypothetical protein
MHHYQCQNVYISSTASERIVDTLEFFPHTYQMPQLSSTARLIMAAKDMKDALQNPHPEVPSAHVGDGYNFQTQVTTNSTSHASSCASHGQTSHMHCRIIQSNLSFSHVPATSNEITYNNSHTRHNQRAITSEGGHTKDAQPITSEGAHSLTESLSPQPVPKRLLRNGHCPHGHRPQKKPLVSAASSERCHPPCHQKRNGIHDTCEGPPSTTTLDTRLWQRMRTPIPRHSGHSWNQHMFIYQTHQRPKRQKVHLRKNSLQLQTSQERKGTRPVDRGRRHA